MGVQSPSTAHRSDAALSSTSSSPLTERRSVSCACCCHPRSNESDLSTEVAGAAPVLTSCRPCSESKSTATASATARAGARKSAREWLLRHMRDAPGTAAAASSRCAAVCMAARLSECANGSKSSTESAAKENGSACGRASDCPRCLSPRVS
eukprot:6175606-Pleurochrysis_carterae.AAC.1